MLATVRRITASLKCTFILPLFLLGVAGHAPIVMAQSPGTFTATGIMTTPRSEHTETLLTNGKVLIAGGYGFGSRILGSAELYDPATDTFAATGNMTTARRLHTATLLANGRVLIVGGYGPFGGGERILASAELYDPDTGTFTATGGIITAQGAHTATLLGNGTVLLAGGQSPGGYLVSAELYDPVTGVFTPTGDMTTPVWGPATLLADGRVLITGGSTELYDPSTGTFSTGAMHPYGGEYSQTATLLMNGKVLFAGGDDYGAQVYDPSTGTFTATGNLTKSRDLQTATLLPDGTVLIAGSQMPGGNGIVSAELYDPATGTFSATGDMTTPRHFQTATLLNNGKVLIAGGYSFFPARTSTAELYNPPSLVLAPVLFSLSGDGRGQGAILHAATQQIVSADNPAIAGEALEIYLTGLVDGSVIPPQVSIGGSMAEILYFGNAPGLPALNQVNVRVPSGVTPGPAVSVHLTYLGRASNQVTIGVQ